MKIANTDREGLLNDLKNFNEIFRKDVTYDNIKNHKKPGFYSLFRRYIFGKTGEVKLITLPTPSSQPF